jgi:carbon-monoxide dehydrogenase medium subunit
MKSVSPGLPEFDYIRAETIEQVSELLKNGKPSRLLMGGTDVFVQMRDGAISPAQLVDVKHLPGMQSIQKTGSKGLRIGAAVDLNTLAGHPEVVKRFPLLAEAAQSVGSFQLRSRATMGGNLCNASPAADTGPAALVLEAILIAQGSNGERRIPAQEFFTGPGQNALQDGEILTNIEIPPTPKGSVGRYLKLGRNAEGDLAIAGVAVLGYADKASKSGLRFRVALSSVAPTPIRVPAAEGLLESQKISDEMIGAAAKAARRTAKPIDDVRASADYRSAMVEVHARRAIHTVWAALRGEA